MIKLSPSQMFQKIGLISKRDTNEDKQQDTQEDKQIIIKPKEDNFRKRGSVNNSRG